MLKKILVSFLSFALVLSFAGISLAQSDSQQLPETDGVYDVPGNSKLKLRVIVHKAKSVNPGKPTPKDKPTLVCNLADPNSEATVGATGWHLPSNWTYSLNPKSAPASIRSNLATIAQNSFGTWTDHTIGQVAISRAADTSLTRQAFDSKNLVAWNRINATALAITYTWYYPSTGEVAENDTIMNKRYSWDWTPYALDACLNPNTYDAQNILTHEVGHWMGLDDEYAADYVDNTMYGYGDRGEIKKDTLTSGDITGLDTIY